LFWVQKIKPGGICSGGIAAFEVGFGGLDWSAPVSHPMSVSREGRIHSSKT
jgi:hypothetical protein